MHAKEKELCTLSMDLQKVVYSLRIWLLSQGDKKNVTNIQSSPLLTYSMEKGSKILHLHHTLQG